jgi:hypothetical protein
MQISCRLCENAIAVRHLEFSVAQNLELTRMIQNMKGPGNEIACCRYGTGMSHGLPGLCKLGTTPFRLERRIPSGTLTAAVAGLSPLRYSPPS